MKKTLLSFISLGTFLITPFLLSAQPLDLQIHVYDVEKLQVLYVADLGLIQQELTKELFGVDIRNQTGSEYHNCVMFIQISKDDQMLTRTESRPFLIPSSDPGHLYSTNNAELLNNNFYFDPGNSNTHVVLEPADVSGDVPDLHKDMLTTGKMPLGEYKLYISITGDEGELASKEVIFISPTNPSFVSLVGPGSQYGSAYPEEIYSQYPVFQYNGNGSEYEIRVFEKRGAFQTLDDILLSTPNWASERLSVLSVQYPQIGNGGSPLVPLEYGKTYYWVVKMFIETSAGQESITSEVWQYTLTDPTNPGIDRGTIAKNDILDFLRNLIGSRADEFARELDGYSLDNIILNGQVISMQSLNMQLNSAKYQRGNLEVVELEMD